MKIFILFLCLISITNIYGQVNIEKFRNLKDSGKLLNSYRQILNINTAVNRTTSSFYSIGFNYFKAFKLNPLTHSFLITKMNYGKNDGEEFLNHNFYHLRIIGVNEIFNIKPEIYFQYEKNDFASTKERYLYGLGVRYKLSKKAVSGTSILNEWYKEKDQNSQNSKWRLSQYFQYRMIINKFNRLDTTFYIQPNINNFSDIRYFSEIIFSNQLTESISYNSTLTSKYYNKSKVFNEVELFFKSGLEFKL